MMTAQTEQPVTAPGAEAETLDNCCREIQGEIVRLRRFSSRGLWALSLFLLVGIIAWHHFPYLVIPEKLAVYLGKPPSSQMVSVVLLIYTFSAIMLSLSRMTAGIEHRSSFCHVGYLTAIFLFYHFDKGLDDNYWAVIGAGVTILGVESYRIWAYCNEAIRKKQEDLDFIRRTGRMPIEE